jgi:hypothetical protein
LWLIADFDSIARRETARCGTARRETNNEEVKAGDMPLKLVLVVAVLVVMTLAMYFGLRNSLRDELKHY